MNTTKKIGIALAVLMVLALAAPATAEYVAEDTKMNIYKQLEKGDLDYTYGTPFYQCIWGPDSVGSGSETATYNIDLSHLTPNQLNKIESARLYVYWTWSTVDVCDLENKTSGEYFVSSTRDYATYPALEVAFNGGTVPFDYAPDTDWEPNYTDSKNIAGVGKQYGETGYVSWNFPAGTNCSTIPVNLVSDNNVVTVTNVKPYVGPDGASYCSGPYYGKEFINSTKSGRAYVCVQGVGLLLTLKDSSKRYWIAEGNDMTYVSWSTKYLKWSYGITPDLATTTVKFEGNVQPSMNTATLTSVVPAGDSSNNRLYFNDFNNYDWDGLWNRIPDKNLAVSVTDVSASFEPGGDNVARFQNGLVSVPQGDRQMNVANAFLVVEH